jgi:hypothetical protein
LCKFPKPCYIQKFNFYLKKNFPQISDHPAQPRPRWPAMPRRPPDPRSGHSAKAALAYLPKGVFPSTLRTPVETPSLSHVTAMWGSPVSSIPFPTPVDRCRFSSPPPTTPRRPASNLETPSEVFTPRLDSSSSFPPLTPHQAASAINGVNAITAGRLPLPRPGMPLPSHYKRARSTPRPSPHSPHPHLLAPDSATSTPPSASSVGCSPPSPGRVCSSATPSCNQ